MLSFFCNYPVYYINLSKDISRKQSIEKEFQGYPKLHRIDAIDGTTQDSFNQYFIQHSPQNYWSNGYISVICSHAKAIFQAKKTNAEMAFVFEDDVHLELLPYFNTTILELTKQLPNDWDMLQLSYPQIQESDLIESIQKGLFTKARVHNDSTSCYCISRMGMEKFLSTRVSTDGEKTFTIHPKISEIEQVLYESMNTYKTSLPLFHFACDSGTYESYFQDTANNLKNACQTIHNESKEKMLHFAKQYQLSRSSLCNWYFTNASLS